MHLKGFMEPYDLGKLKKKINTRINNNLGF